MEEAGRAGVAFPRDGDQGPGGPSVSPHIEEPPVEGYRRDDVARRKDAAGISRS